MTIEQLNYILEVHNEKSINKAAKNLFVSQSAISQAIAQVERELGTKIFARSSRGVETTPYGRMFIRYVIPIQDQLKRIGNMFRETKERPSNTLTVACDDFQIIGDICAYLIKKYSGPSIRIEHYDSYGDEARTLVANGVAEVGIVRFWDCHRNAELLQLESMGLQYSRLDIADITIMVGKGNPLYYREDLDAITPGMLSESILIRYGYLDAGPYKDIVDILQLPYSKSEIVTSSRQAVTEWLKYANTYYLNSAWPEIDMFPGRICADQRIIPLAGTGVRSERGWVVKQDQVLSPIAKEFVSILRQNPMDFLKMMGREI